MSKPTQLIKSSIPNAFTIKNANGTDVVMSLQNTSNQLWNHIAIPSGSI